MNKQEEFNCFKSNLLELISCLTNRENLKKLIEKTETFDNILQILKSKLSLSEKEKEIVREFIQ